MLNNNKDAKDPNANLPKKLKVESMDHVVLTVKDLKKTEEFYANILGMIPIGFGDGRIAMKFGDQKINLHQRGIKSKPCAEESIGSTEICFISKEPLNIWVEYLSSSGVEVIEGPVMRTGANCPISSIYIRDPDENLIQLSNLCW